MSNLERICLTATLIALGLTNCIINSNLSHTNDRITMLRDRVTACEQSLGSKP